MALCLTIAACGSNRALNPNNSEKPSPNASIATPDTTTQTPTEITAGTEEPIDTLSATYAAYADTLNNLLQNNMLPDGAAADDLFGDMAQNQFSLCDVDNDGKEELLLMYTTASMAGMTGYVFGYDAQTEKLHIELSVFPLLTFYDNGIIKAGWSHNQGRAGDSFWPYSLYQYVPETDSYVLVGMVDAWDKNYGGSDDQDNPFPSDIDISGTGYVYYIMKDGQYDTSNPVDASEYNAWISSYLGDASEIQIEYMDLTEENVSLLRSAV
jgi:hypothetical protein